MDDSETTLAPDIPGPDTPHRPVFTIKQACDVCQVSRRTITRHLDNLAKHGASKDADGRWMIPVEALEAVGLRPGRPAAPTETTLGSDTRQKSLDDTAAQVIPVPLARYEELIKAEAERLALHQHLDDMRQSAVQWHQYAQTLLRQLEPAETVVDLRDQQPAKRRWFARN